MAPRSGNLSSTLPLAIAVALFSAGGVVGIWALWQFTPRQLAELATFLGGTVGPLWSAASLLLLYTAYGAQRSQLELQRHEIHDAAEEQQRSRIEARFYQLIRLHNLQVDNLDASGRSTKNEVVPIRAKRCVYSYYANFRSEYGKEFIQWQGMIGQDPQRLRAILTRVEKNHPGSLHGYYVSVDSLLKAVEKAYSFDRQLAEDLAEVLVAQFADFELALLFVKFYTDARFGNALALARKHAFFRYFDESSIWLAIEGQGRERVT